MNIKNRTIDDKLIITLNEPRLDLNNASDFLGQIKDDVESGTQKVALDLSQLRVLDSSGVAAFISIRNWVREKGKFVVFGASGTVKNLLSLTRMPDVFDVANDEADALKRLDQTSHGK